jgi:hypothetical protein
MFSIDSSSTPGACSLGSDGVTVSFTGVGSCVIDADQAGNEDYLRASQQQQAVTIRMPQSIGFTSTAPSKPIIGDTYVVGATGGASGNAVIFSIDSSSTSGACSLRSDGITVSFTAVGSCVIDANQAGNDNYWAAPEQQQSMFSHVRATTTTVKCSPNPVAQGAAKGTQCTSTVTDSQPDGTAITPSGSVTIDITNPQGSLFTDSCVLATSASGDSSACAVNYSVPPGSQTRTVKAYYTSDSVHKASLATTLLSILPAKVSSTANSFKTKCSFAGEGQFDPIRYPGQSPAGHIHEFFGNTQIGPGSTGFSLQAAGTPTTCADAFDTADYWVPELFADGQPVQPTGVDVYYERIVGLQLASGDPCPLTVTCNGQTFESVVVPPTDMRMIAGNSAATSPQAQSVIKWSCENNTGVGALPPNCAGKQRLTVHIVFPGCWDGGTDLETNGTNNVAYMTVKAGVSRCPAGHDYPIPRLALTVHYNLNPTEPACSSTVTTGCINYAISEWDPVSQQPELGPPFTMHADWLNGWQTGASIGTPDPDAFDQLIARCNNGPDGTPNCGVVQTKPPGSALVPFT